MFEITVKLIIDVIHRYNIKVTGFSVTFIQLKQFIGLPGKNKIEIDTDRSNLLHLSYILIEWHVYTWDDFY